MHRCAMDVPHVILHFMYSYIMRSVCTSLRLMFAENNVMTNVIRPRTVCGGDARAVETLDY